MTGILKTLPRGKILSASMATSLPDSTCFRYRPNCPLTSLAILLISERSFASSGSIALCLVFSGIIHALSSHCQRTRSNGNRPWEASPTTLFTHWDERILVLLLHTRKMIRSAQRAGFEGQDPAQDENTIEEKGVERETGGEPSRSVGEMGGGELLTRSSRKNLFPPSI